MVNEEIVYARDPGSKGYILESQWNPKAPYGHCPACGSPGIECREKKERASLETALPEEGIVLFSCSDKTCRTKRTPRIRRAKRTVWYEPRN